MSPTLVGFAFLLAAGLVVLLVARRQRPLAYALAAAFGLRAAAAVVQAFTHRLPDSSMDAVSFDSVAWAWANDPAGLASHFVFDAYFFSWLLAWPYKLFGHSELMALSFNVLLGTLTVLNVALAARELWGERAGRRAAWVAALWPSLILYSAILLREAPYAFLLSLGAFLLARWFRDARPWWLALSSGAIALAAWFHRGAAPAIAILLLAAAAGVLRALWRREGAAAGRHFGSGAAAATLGVLLVAPLLGVNVMDLVPRFEPGADAPPSPPPPAEASPSPPTPSPASTPTPPPPTPPTQPTGPPPVLTPNEFKPDTLQARQDASAGARSAYLMWLPQDSVLDAVWQAPLRSAYFLFSPMPWDVSAPKDVIGLLDGLLYLGIAVLLWRGRHALGRNGAALAILGIVVLLVVIYAANTFNAGTALRHRAKLAPLLVALVPAVAWPTLRHNGTRTRVLHVVNAPESFLQNRLPLARAARDAGYDVQVAGPMGPAVERIRDLGFSYHVVDLDRRGTNPVREARTLVQLARVYRQARPDVVHHFTIKPVVYGGVAARVALVPASVHTITGLGYVFTSGDLRARVLRPLVSLAYQFSFDHPRGRIVFQNEDDARLLASKGIALPGTTALVRGSGVDLSAYRPQPEPEGAPLVVLPSRMLRDKGVVEFVDAARRLHKTGARFALVGDTDDGNPAAIPRAQLEAWAKEGAVEWWGHRNDMPDVYAKAHVVCLPSYREGVPKSLLEAAACGRALVATDAPGCRDVVADGETGLLVPPRDAGALAEALGRVIADPALRRRLGANARKLAEEHFGAERIAAEYLAVYGGLAR